MCEQKEEKHLMQFKYKFLVIGLLTIATLGCATAPVVYTFEPERSDDGTITVTPWFGETAYFLRIDNLSDETVTINPDSLVVVSDVSEARELSGRFLSEVIPPGAHTYVDFTGPDHRWQDTRFASSPVQAIVALHRQNSLQQPFVASGPPASARQVQTFMASHAGESVTIRLEYSTGDSTVEQITEFVISGAHILESR